MRSLPLPAVRVDLQPAAWEGGGGYVSQLLGGGVCTYHGASGLGSLSLLAVRVSFLCSSASCLGGGGGEGGVVYTVQVISNASGYLVRI